MDGPLKGIVSCMKGGMPEHEVRITQGRPKHGTSRRLPVIIESSYANIRHVSKAWN